MSLPAHEEPRFHTWVDREQQQASVQVVFQRPAPPLASPADLRTVIAEELFMAALNNRFFRISRRTDPPFYSASVSVHMMLHHEESTCLPAADFGWKTGVDDIS